MIANTAAYHFAVIDAPQALCDQLLARAEAAGLRGTILVAGEGLNLFLAGAPEAVEVSTRRCADARLPICGSRPA
jgi:UPF0176 protein